MKAKEQWFARLPLALWVGWLAPIGCLGPISAPAEVNLSVSLNIQSPADFYGPLSADGSWVDVSRQGRCWRPADVPPGWQPYSVGHWEWTDAGWYWVSDEPWAWACYHYGQWIMDPVYGWVWLPGTEWAPAWVVWRQAPDYIGWAPCGPGGAAFSDSSFVFVDVHHFHDRLGPRELVFHDAGLLRRSRPVGRFETETRDFDGVRRRIAINRGPGVDPIQRATGSRFEPRPVRELARQTAVPERARRTESFGSVQAPSANQQPARRTEREQPRLYREAPQAQPPPTGRQEPRIYREIPNPQPAPGRPALPPRQPLPEVSTPRVQAPSGVERGRPEDRGPRQAEHAPRIEPAPQQPPAPVAPQGPPPRPKDRD